MPCLWRMKKMRLSVSFTFRCVFISVWASLELCTLYRTLLFLDHHVMTLTLCYNIHLKIVCASKSIQGLALYTGVATLFKKEGLYRDLMELPHHDFFLINFWRENMGSGSLISISGTDLFTKFEKNVCSKVYDKISFGQISHNST